MISIQGDRRASQIPLTAASTSPKARAKSALPKLTTTTSPPRVPSAQPPSDKRPRPSSGLPPMAPRLSDLSLQVAQSRTSIVLCPTKMSGSRRPQSGVARSSCYCGSQSTAFPTCPDAVLDNVFAKASCAFFITLLHICHIFPHRLPQISC